VWKDNRRRRVDVTLTEDIIRTFGPDHHAVFVGDAAMSPYEITHAGGSVEHWNKESGEVWLSRLTGHFRRSIWLNPVREDYWGYTSSIGIVRHLFAGQMYPLTLGGLEQATRALSR